MLAATPDNVLRTIARFPPDRVAGSLAERQACNVILDELHHAGISAHAMAVDVTSYRVGPSSLVVDTQRGSVHLDCYPYLGTLPFQDAMFRHMVVMDEDGTITDAQQDGHEPTILVTQQRCDDRLVSVLQKQGLDAFIHVLGPHGPLQCRLARLGPSGSCPPVRGVITTYPAAQVLLRNHGECQIRVSAASSEVPAQGSNVVVNEPALDRPDGILITAHLDTVLGTPGIGDNAIGCAILLEMCKGLMATPLGSRVCFVWTTGEEYGAEGIRALCGRWKERCPPPGLLAIILDALGGAISKNEVKVFIPSGHTRQERWLGGTMPGAQVYPGERPRNDGGPLFDIGIPCVAVHRFGGYMHAQDDSMDKVTPFGIAKSVDLVMRALEQVLAIGDE